MTPRRAVLVAGLVAALGACAVGPHYRAPAPDMPPNFAAADGAARGGAAPAGAAATGRGAAPVDLAAWWKSLDDPELDSLMERAVRSNPDIEIALARLQQARTYVSVVAGHALPEIDASGAAARGTGSDLSRGRAQQALVSADNGSGLQHINTLVGVDTVWQLDLFGKYRREIEAARDDAQAAMAARNAVLTGVLANVARAYVDLRGFQMQLGVLHRAQGVLRESLRIVTLRYQRGITNELDVALAKRELETLQAQIQPLEAQQSAAEYTIAVLLGQYPEQLTAELGKPNLVPSVPGPAEPGTPVELLRRRPDVRQAERQLASATARIGVATASLFPQVAAVASIGSEGQGWGTVPALGKHLWSFGPAALWPVLDFGALDAQVDMAQIEARASLVSYRKTLLNAVQSVDTALDDYNAEQDRLRHVGEALLAGQRAVDLANQRYDRGLTDFLNVVDAERQYYDLQEQYTAAQVSEAEHFVDLYESLGGGWQNYTDVPAIRRPQPAIIAVFRRVLTDPWSAPDPKALQSP
ncbi:MAG TPA: efflux transporter outer membrane subunit [Steroidobacteraceae bacterium]|nr:efflux transporter outer membrane subunit [Steroidobacteraceae bacterium]